MTHRVNDLPASGAHKVDYGGQVPRTRRSLSIRAG